MRAIIFLFSLMVTLTLTQCMSYDFARRITQQGNLLPYSKVERLKVGMSKSDVNQLMGTSIISPLFNDNRWDYAYSYRKGSGPIEIRHATVYFSRDHIVRIEHKP